MTDAEFAEFAEQMAEIVVRHGDRIFVREQIDGHWDSVALTSLPLIRQLCWVAYWAVAGRLPCYVREGIDV